jgi:L-cysteine:1D-myo-inositol 2-amino-2-deoxy-alpha-D-glucopyranoside ligase
MRAWSGPDVPVLTQRFGSAPAVVIHDTQSHGHVVTGSGDAARLYVCGITPYDATHLGHAATYLAFDLLVRAWRDAGHAVDYVQNVTDVDDPLLERARETGQDYEQLAERETELFRADMAALRMVAPSSFVGAVEAMPLIIDAVEQLREQGAAYDVDGDLYFPVTADPFFGSVSGLGRTAMVELFRERGGDPDRTGKKDPLDCLVWQHQRPGDPAWDSTLGRGRPGWHIECTAIALHHLGANFDVQGGGSDLVFPHHEMCASEAHVVTGRRPFAQGYVHAGMVGLQGEKMSKSRGNLVLVSTLRETGVDPMAIRLALLGHHYRDDWDWTDADLTGSEDRLRRWRAAAVLPSGPGAGGLVAEVRRALADDLDAPRALAAIDDWVEAAQSGTGGDAAAPALMRDLCDARLGVLV